jgi:hypothetical protein
MTNFFTIIFIVLLIIGMIYYINNKQSNQLSIYKDKNLNFLDPKQIEKLNSNQLKKLSIYQLASILLYLKPSQLISLDIIPMSNNITNIINNNDISNIDFSKYYPNELLFLSVSQVQKLSTSQLISICNINIHSTTTNITALTSIYNKLSFAQLQTIAISDKYYAIPFNRLSLEQFSSLMNSLTPTIRKKIINTPMFFTTLSIEKFKIIMNYLTQEQIEKYNNTANQITEAIQKLVDNIPPLPIPQKLPNGEINSNLETNGQLIVYLPIIILLGSPTLTSKLLNANTKPVEILKRLPKIIINYLIPTSVDALYFIDPYLLKLYNDANLINNIPLTNNNSIPEKQLPNKTKQPFQNASESV